MKELCNDNKRDIIGILSQDGFLCVMEHCLNEKELIDNFQRLYGINIPDVNRPPLYRMVDKMTGFEDEAYREFFMAFIPFVDKFIYKPVKKSSQ